MADLALTSAVFLDGYAPVPVKAGAAVAVTDILYIDNTDGTGKQTSANALTTSQASGIALVTGASGNLVHYAGPGSRVTVNAVLTKGVAYYVSATSGKLCPFADLVAGKYISLFGIADSTTVLAVICSNRLVTV